MKTRLLIVIGLGLMSFLTFIPHNAYACSCDGYPDYLRLLMEYDTAFQGTVTKIIQNDHNQEIHFDVTLPQKNISQTNEFVLEQSLWNSCIVNYNVGETYQVFVYGDSTIGKTNMCSTKQITGFHEYSHEDENGQIEHFREDYNILTQYNLGTIILPIITAMIIPSIIVWRKRK
ncbi:MAG: hypothetical protein K5790_01560 [Nitrosopumilus sp.]|uniref:hypothetical protein n=1 Tax=Nitrosopumilus sp. TaxID=2024843 RepID=UPI00247F13DC|nr:hypothetical protein [Nitrosopumilus sp.]MCV0391961.1 hypothetical protein [Nitrosopumilus sp.]